MYKKPKVITTVKLNKKKQSVKCGWSRCNLINLPR